jgi:putative FmdB family regulatory protein
MPVYVYHCGNCEFEFEQQQKFTDKPLKVCPECGQSLLHKVYSPVGVIYKGSGFYSTDHRSSSSSLSYSKGKTEEKKDGVKEEKKEGAKEEKKETVKEEKKSKPEKAKPVESSSGE